MKKELLIISLIIGLIVMFGIAQADPIPYHWGTDHYAYFEAHSEIGVWSQGQYVIDESICDNADTNPSEWHHNPPAETSLSESYSYESGEWSGDSYAISDANGIYLSSTVSTNPYVNADDNTYSKTYGWQNGYFYIDSVDKFLKVDFILNLSGNDSIGRSNHAGVDLNWYLNDYGTELGDSYTRIATVSINWNFNNINNPSIHEDHWLIPLEKGHWYYLFAYAGETLRAYQNDLVNGDIDLSLQISSVPIPTAGILLLPGVLGLIGIRRKVFKT